MLRIFNNIYLIKLTSIFYLIIICILSYGQDNYFQQQVNTTNSTYTNGARFGMVFNNCIKLFIANGMKWTTGEFIDNFRRVEGWVEACENPSTTPLNTQPNEPIPNGIQETVVVNEDDLPF